MLPQSSQRIPITDQDKDRFAQAFATVTSYSTCLYRNGNLAGSGTFVKCGEKYGILTAHHVAFQSIPPFNFSPASTDKLTISVMTGRAHRLEFQMQYLVSHEIGRPASASCGPDLLFLEIPNMEPKLQIICAKCCFWNLSRNPSARISECCNTVNCVWCRVGYPNQWARDVETPTPGFIQELGVWGECGLTEIDRTFEEGGFDYIDTYAECAGRTGVLNSLQGESGGGLWRIPLVFAEDPESLANWTVGEPILTGVLFYQGPLEGNRRTVRAHGPRSLYEIAVQVINA